MLGLAVVTCVLGTALAKPSPSADSKNLADVTPLDFEPMPYEDSRLDDQLMEFKEGRRLVYTLPDGRYFFTSQNYPRNYTNNFRRIFVIRGDSRQDITIDCSPFRMEFDSRCLRDFLQINRVRYCGTNAPRMITGPWLVIVIWTNRRVTDTGFYCRVTVGSDDATTTTEPPATTTEPRCRCGQRQSGRIVGGTNATLGEFGWQAGLVPRGSSRTFCGGSLINDRFVLTAAHCTDGSSASQIQVLLGDLRIGQSDAGEQRFSVRRIIEHPQYVDAIQGGFDFSLVELERQVTFSDTISPVCLAQAGQSYANVPAIASGYGRVGASEPQSDILLFVEVDVWSQSRCASVFGSILRDNMICAGGSPEGGESVCNGDSGGPLVTLNSTTGSFELIGVVSFARPCAFPNTPDVYARVTVALDWIRAETANARYCDP